MPETLCVKGCGEKARRNPESKGMCLDCSLKEENKSIRRKTSSVEEICACGAKSTDPGETRFKDGKCKKCRSKEAQQRWYEKHKKSPEA